MQRPRECPDDDLGNQSKRVNTQVNVGARRVVLRQMLMCVSSVAFEPFSPGLCMSGVNRNLELATYFLRRSVYKSITMAEIQLGGNLAMPFGSLGLRRGVGRRR